MAVDVDSLAQAVAEAIGREAVVLDPGELERYSWDALGPNRAFRLAGQIKTQPLLAARPRSTEEVAAVVRLAAQRGLAVVPYGGGTGVMGAAVPVQPSLVLDLGAMDRVLAISRSDRTVHVQAGMVLERLDRELAAHGLMLAHDPWSLPIATVGGAISTNGMGYRVGRYGSMGDQVLGLTVVLADGRVLRTRGVQGKSAGLDLNHLFIGTEGCFGVITEAVLRCLPLPEARVLAAYAFDSFEAGFEAIMAMDGIGLVPSVLDYGEDFEPGADTSRPVSAGAKLYLAFEGFRQEVEAQRGRADEICRASGGRPLPPREAESFWEHRHDIALRFARGRRQGRPREPVAGARFDYVHVSLPPSRVLDYRRRCQEVLARRRVLPLEYGIWGRPGLFDVVMVQPEGDGDSLAEAVDELLVIAQDMGGSMEQCHGVGLKLLHLMEREHGLGLELMRAIKRALDPQGILNPGKLAL
ncbi:MAG: FAD-binding oxidoreductase [Dehalococcoidia bacterium]|nr:FAD-binding oxidoreductase [Dehalococcoidia bacterium]MDW8007986.1 FAD-binding oxidoreductase [Chloroflexota bacterium]